MFPICIGRFFQAITQAPVSTHIRALMMCQSNTLTISEKFAVSFRKMLYVLTMD